jgi:Amt family ammonium transporter
MIRRSTWLTVLLSLGVGIVMGSSLVTIRAQEPAEKKVEAPAAPAAAPTAEAAAPAPAPDPTKTPTGPDSTGGGYTGASMTAALTKDADKVTTETLAKDVKLVKIGINVMWTLITGFLVMFMQAGFAMVETGFTRAKNVAHTMSMNFMVYGLGMLGFWIAGFAFMFGGVGSVATMDGPAVLDKMWTLTIGGKDFALLGYKGFFLTGSFNDATVLTMFLFQMVFMDTTATIPTGAMAERWKFSAFCVYAFFVSMIIYPVFGCWVWGGGWLSQLGKNFGLGNGHLDFAGSSVVHMTGGVTALVGAWVLGPRIGKYNRDGSANPIPGHDIPMAVIGTFILAFGWFGFNPGSTLAGTDLRIASVATCTMLASAAGAMSAMVYMWAVFGKPDPSMLCNGMLAGLVAITAPSGFVDPVGAVLIGAIAGVLVIWSVLFVERVLKVDDPVGAVSVHGVCGAWGCLSIGLFASGQYGAGLNRPDLPTLVPTGLFYGGGLTQLAAEAVGVATNFIWVGGSAFLTFKLIDLLIGNRVSAKTEIEGLDIPEMGVLGYITEDTRAIQVAGEEFLATHGPGVPTRVMPEPDRRVPVGRS